MEDAETIMVYLITGKSGAGKTHYATALLQELKFEGKKAIMLDGDQFRESKGNSDFSDRGRIQNLMNAAVEAQRLENLGFVVILAFIAPKKRWRDSMCSYWKESRIIYLPGGSLWPGTEYEKPDDMEVKDDGVSGFRGRR